MPFVRTSLAPERIFLYASPGGGKTYATFCIARTIALMEDPARIFLVDTDNAFYDLIGEVPEAEGVIQPIFVDQSEEGQEWNELVESIDKALKDSDPKRNDWIVVDRVDPAWEWVQDSYVRAAKKASIDEVREKARDSKDGNLRAGLTGFEWGETKTKFRKPFNKLMVSGRNIIITAGATSISQYTDSSGQKADTYGGLPWAAAGGAGSLQLAHIVRDTICLRCTDSRKGIYLASTGKPRGRPVSTRMENVPIKDFAEDVLVARFGWKYE